MAGFRDVVILLPGITGSVLANKAGKEVWAPSAGAVWRAVTSIGRSIEGLELTADDAEDAVTPTRLVPDATIVPGLVKIDGYSRIERYLIDQLGLEAGRNYFAFPYDWRRDSYRQPRACVFEPSLSRQRHALRRDRRRQRGASGPCPILVRL